MSTRQVRLNDQKEIRNRIKSFLGKEINIVLKDHMVFLGQLKNVSENKITIVNMRREDMTFNFETISELFFDQQE